MLISADVLHVNALYSVLVFPLHRPGITFLYRGDARRSGLLIMMCFYVSELPSKNPINKLRWAVLGNT